MAKTPTETTHSEPQVLQRNGFTETLCFYDRPGGPPGNTVILWCEKCQRTEDKGHANDCANRPALKSEPTPEPNPLHVEVVEHAQPHAAQVRFWADWVWDEPDDGSTHALAAKELRAAADYIERLESENARMVSENRTRLTGVPRR